MPEFASRTHKLSGSSVTRKTTSSLSSRELTHAARPGCLPGILSCRQLFLRASSYEGRALYPGVVENHILIYVDPDTRLFAGQDRSVFGDTDRRVDQLVAQWVVE